MVLIVISSLESPTRIPKSRRWRGIRKAKNGENKRTTQGSYRPARASSPGAAVFPRRRATLNDICPDDLNKIFKLMIKRAHVLFTAHNAYTYTRFSVCVYVKFVGFTLPPGRIKVKGRIRLRGQSTAFQYGRHRNATRFRAWHTQRSFFFSSSRNPLTARDHDDCGSSSPLPRHLLRPDRVATSTTAVAAATIAVTAVLRDRRLPGEEETTVVVVGRGPAVRENTVLPQSVVYVPPMRPIARTASRPELVCLCRCDGACVCVCVR